MAKTITDIRDILPDPNYVRIFDTTLRDGEQSPGCTMNVEEKLAIARQLERLGVDIIEGGFAASSPGDFESVHRIAEAVTRPTVVSLSRTREEDVDAALRAVDKARNPGIHIFIATSDIHLKYKLNMTREDVLSASTWAVARAKQHLDYIEFSCEDASRSDWDYMAKICTEVIRAGARIINLPDTTGHAIPEEFGEMFAYMRSHVEGADRVIWSAHCHNDLGLAVANSLAAIKNGVRQVECTINGIGERAGNTSMEEVVMALRTRQDLMEVRTGIDTRQIYPASRLLSQIIGQPVPPNKPIVGDNAFAHEAGIHQDGVLKYKLTYEIMKPEDIGIPSNKLVLGKHSGRHAFVNRLEELGVDPAVDRRQQGLRRVQGAVRQEENRLRRRYPGPGQRGDAPHRGPFRTARRARDLVGQNHAARRSHDAYRGWRGAHRRGLGRRDGRRVLQGDLQAGRRAAGARALLGQGHHRRHRRAGRGELPGMLRRHDRRGTGRA